MTTFFSFLKQHKIPPKGVVHSLLSRPLTWMGLTLYILMTSILVISYLLILRINDRFLYTVAARGGTVTEGIIGAPRVINPVLATTEPDISLTRLLFSGLMREDSDGKVVPDLAQSYVVSPDGLEYTFTLSEDLAWSDGKPLTSADIAFTISKLTNPSLNTDPYWRDITIANPDPLTIVFTLSEQRPDLLKRATIGILPEHRWEGIPDEAFEQDKLNLNPVGSGPYAFVSLSNERDIASKIVLKRNRHYAHEPPYINKYVVMFFANQNALRGALDDEIVDLTLAADPQNATRVSREFYDVRKINTSVTVGLYRLQDEATLRMSEFRSALNHLIDKQSILDTVEHGYGMLPGVPMDTMPASPQTQAALDELMTLGYVHDGDILKKNGVPVSFSVATKNDPVHILAARTLAGELSRLGITMTIKAFDHGMFQDVVRAQQYPIIFAEVRDDDPISSYEPAITLYTKAYPFVLKKSLHVSISDSLDSPVERYRQSNAWHVRTNDVWKIFLPNQQQ